MSDPPLAIEEGASESYTATDAIYKSAIAYRSSKP